MATSQPLRFKRLLRLWVFRTTNTISTEEKNSEGRRTASAASAAPGNQCWSGLRKGEDGFSSQNHRIFQRAFMAFTCKNECEKDSNW